MFVEHAMVGKKEIHYSRFIPCETIKLGSSQQLTIFILSRNSIKPYRADESCPFDIQIEN
jgi:hypothetical protein